MSEELSSRKASIDVHRLGTTPLRVTLDEVHVLLPKECLVLTEDRIRLCLMTHLGRVSAKASWHTPLGIFLTLALTIATVKFQDNLLDAGTWRGLFLSAAVLSGFWLARSVVQAMRAPTIEDVIAAIKRDPGVRVRGEPTPPS